MKVSDVSGVVLLVPEKQLQRQLESCQHDVGHDQIKARYADSVMTHSQNTIRVQDAPAYRFEALMPRDM